LEGPLKNNLVKFGSGAALVAVDEGSTWRSGAKGPNN